MWFLHGAHSNIDSTRITWTRNDTLNNNNLNNCNNNRKPYFEVSGLVPGMGYNVFLIAHNSKGRSNATILQVYTLKDPEKQTGESRKKNTNRKPEKKKAQAQPENVVRNGLRAACEEANRFAISCMSSDVRCTMLPPLHPAGACEHCAAYKLIAAAAAAIRVTVYAARLGGTSTGFDLSFNFAL